MKRRISNMLLLAATTLASCDTLRADPGHVVGVWGGQHVGLALQGGLADVQFDCASGTIDDPLYPRPDGSFSLKGTYRTGTPGPVRVGQIFRSQPAIYSGRITAGSERGAARLMTLRVTLEDGTDLGPFSLTESSPPQLTRCL